MMLVSYSDESADPRAFVVSGLLGFLPEKENRPPLSDELHGALPEEWYLCPLPALRF